MKYPITTPGNTYAITSPNGCTVTQRADDTTIVNAVSAGVQTLLIAQAGRFEVSDDAAVVTECGGSASLVSTVNAHDVGNGCMVRDVDGEALQVSGATWFRNTAQSSISVQPAVWKNMVLTCYIQTSLPVTLEGVTWLYGAPEMGVGITYVIALQQVDAATVLANLAYALPQ